MRTSSPTSFRGQQFFKVSLSLSLSSRSTILFIFILIEIFSNRKFWWNDFKGKFINVKLTRRLKINTINILFYKFMKRFEWFFHVYTYLQIISSWNYFTSCKAIPGFKIFKINSFIYRDNPSSSLIYIDYPCACRKRYTHISRRKLE